MPVRRMPSVAAALLLVAAAFAPVAAQEPADFDGSGAVDWDDLAQLRRRLGTAEARFDLNGSGRVDVGDLFSFADAMPPGRPPTGWPFVDDLPYSVFASDGDLRLSLPTMDVRLRHGPPFGISSLRRRGQWSDFAHPELTLADWEWLYYDSVVTPRIRVKLLDAAWDPPRVRTTPEAVEVTYERPLAHGVVARVRYDLSVERPALRVDYTVVNGGVRDLTDVYLMVGLPGFSDNGEVVEVTSAREQRRPRWPFDDFLAEALGQELPEYQLLRHDARRRVSEGMKGAVTLTDISGTYRLSSYYVATPAVRSVYSAHTNKPRYLTSHLYVTVGDLPAGATATVTVHHVLSGPDPSP